MSDTSKDKLTNEELEKLMAVNYSYPDQSDKDIQLKLYKKREFYGYKVKHRPEINNYEDLRQHRANICDPKEFVLMEHQNLLSNFINPDTPYTGLLIYHGLGSGKCISRESLVYINGTVMRIDDLWEQYHTNVVPDDEINMAYWSQPNKPLYVNSFDTKTNSMVSCPITLMYRQLINEQLREITLESGLTIRITNEHQLLTKNGWKNDLDIGESVFVPKISINTPDMRNEIIPELAIFMAFLIKHSSMFTGNHLKVLIPEDASKLFEHGLKTCIEYYKMIVRFTVSRTYPYAIYKINGIKLYLDTLECNDIAQIPQVIMNSNTNVIKSFLRTYLKKTMSITSNKVIAHQLMYLLRLYNIGTTIVQSHNNDNSCVITIIDIARYQQWINNVIVCESAQPCNAFEYQKIAHIKKVYCYDFVYDLNILEYRNYVANGLLCHNTCAAIAVAEKFKEQIARYNTKIYILVPGPIIKTSWRNQMISCTGSTYKKYFDKNVFVSEQEKQKSINDGILQAHQYYRILSYRSFYRKVLGEKITESTDTTDKEDGAKRKSKYKKTEEGDYERDVSIDQIHNLDNTLLIIDEAHNVTGNDYGLAVKTIIQKSKNLKILLLTATPMKNLADDCIDLLNLIRPQDKLIERDHVFTAEKSHEMKFKEGGMEYLRDMMRGYVSYLRGADSLVYAKRVDIGTIPKSLRFTKIISCHMKPFQQKVYDDAIKEADDALDRTSEAAANITVPGLSSDRLSVTGYYGKQGLNLVRNQLNTNQTQLVNKLNALLKTSERDIIHIGKDNKSIMGNYLHIDHLEMFSTKFYRALKNINKLVWGKRGTRTAFIYSNLVKVGIDIFKNILLQNGVLEYSDKVQPLSSTKCSFCGIPYGEHKGKLTRTSKKKGKIIIPEHTYYPMTFMTVTGSSGDEEDALPEESVKQINDVFNNPSNTDGKRLKFLLGSKVIGEGFNLLNVGEVHILDVHFNFGRVDQVIGRAIRFCSHYRTMSKDNQYPEVYVFKYAVVMPDGTPSSEEKLYSRCEDKHLLVKKVERIMKEEAIDCALNIAGNIFKEEVLLYKECGENGQLCPATCDYEKCDYKCSNEKLNLELFDEEKHVYRKLLKNEIDSTTFKKSLAKTEIDNVKRKIKELYLIGYVYTLDTVVDYVKSFYTAEKMELFDPYYIYKALDELIPITENDFNNYKDTIQDKYNRPGYLIYVNNFYVYQPFELSPDSPMYVRTMYDKRIASSISLNDYMKHSGKNMPTHEQEQLTDEEIGYDFESIQDYYIGRKEFDIVGIIDKEPNKKKLKSFNELEDVFKIREKKKAYSGKKRGVGIQTLTGTVCYNSQQRQFLEKTLKKLNVQTPSSTRIDMCIDIRDALLEREKYGTDRDGNKMTYVIIPANHQTLQFPYNLEDRVEYIMNQINEDIHKNVTMTRETKMENKKPYYTINITLPKDDDYTGIMEKYHAVQDGNKWVITVK